MDNTFGFFHKQVHIGQLTSKLYFADVYNIGNALENNTHLVDLYTTRQLC